VVSGDGGFGRGLPGAALLKFWKVEAIGNDFPLVHLSDVEADELPNLAIRMCDRRFGVGGDGLLAAGMEGSDLRLRMFNPDGTEDFCGNGMRCAAMHAKHQGWMGDEFLIKHLGRSVPTRIEGDLVRTEIGIASYDPEAIPARFDVDPANTFDRVVWSDGTRTLCGSALTTGSTHTVIPGPLPDDASLNELGPRIENELQFPNRTSVIWYEELAPMVLQIRIWERGVGETQGCGTGSSAAAVDYLRRQGLGGNVEVRNPGGSVWISAASWDAPISVTGEAREVFEGAIPD
jgi:diaminopimelate epimerase